jgi:hypothetical protein
MADTVERLYFENEGEVDDNVEDFESFLAQDADAALLALIDFIGECNDAIESTKREIDRLKERADKFGRRLRWAKDKVVEVMVLLGRRKADVGTVEVTVAKGSQSVVEEEGADVWMLPEDCRRVVPETAKPDKKAIAARLKKGERLPGYALERGPERLILK